MTGCLLQVQACSVFVPLVTTDWALSGECEIEYRITTLQLH